MNARSASRPPGRWPANRLREARLLRGLSQARLAARVGVVASTVHRFENGERELTWAAAERLGGALGLPPGDLFLPPRRCSPAVAALAARLAALPPGERDACLLLARALAAGEEGAGESRCQS